MTFTDHVETKHGCHEVVCGLRDARVGTHLTLRSTGTTDCRRNAESCVCAGIRSGPTPLVLGSIKSIDQQLVGFWLFPDIHTSNLCAMISMFTTAFRMPLSRSLLLSPSRISKTKWMPVETPLGTQARCEVPFAAGTSAVQTPATTHPRAPATMCG